MAKKPTSKRKVSVKGRSKLKQAKRIEKVKVLLLIVLAAIIGGFSVWLVNAGSSTYNNSLSDCPVNNTAERRAACANGSAEALTYRYYQGLLKRDADNEGMQFWTVELAGKGSANNTPQRIAQRMLCLNEAYKLGLTGSDASAKVCRSRNAMNTVTQKTDLQYVSWLYTNLLKRPAINVNEEGFNYWVEQLSTKKQTRDSVLFKLASSQEAINKNQAGFVRYIAARANLKSWGVKDMVKLQGSVEGDYLKSDYHGGIVSYIVSSAKTPTKYCLEGQFVTDGKVSMGPLAQTSETKFANKIVEKTGTAGQTINLCETFGPTQSSPRRIGAKINEGTVKIKRFYTAQ